MRRFLLASALLSTTLYATAQDGGRPLWEVGGVALGVSQQAYPGSSQQVQRAIALPYFIYRGQYLRADSDGIGVRAVKTPRYEFDVSAAGAFGSNADHDPIRRGMPSLGTLVEVGPRLKVDLGPAPAGGRWRLDLPVRGVFDLSHQLRYRGAVFQPGVTWSRRAPGALLYGVGASLLVADERLASTFYEVEPRFARSFRPAYEARAGLLGTRLSTWFGKDLTRDWTLFGFAQLNSVAGGANRDSPLVRQVTGHTLGIGLSYTWLRSEARAAD
ncbi:MipA/OmpV family protein [Ramlibacter algicola]|uniref:MipA/OmpV family protein n=1 Tax=Ramlibacter algicola TaxID=2795217 RepID=A0A934URY2_9BURK|nr:MipA/OmpV family protein [Ramlibacter algicola]MBK0393670.1 MipA/OmpV family protein [Ramlibacter algicola]